MNAQDSPSEPISTEELTELLAEATGTTPEEIERGAEAFDVASPSDAELVDE